MGTIIFLGIRDIDNSRGSPEYDGKVRALWSKIRTHPKVQDKLADFDKDIAGCIKPIEDVDSEIKNRWESDKEVIPEKLTETDFEKMEEVILWWASQINVTWKKQEKHTI